MTSVHVPLQAIIMLHTHNSFIVAASTSSTHCGKWQYMEMMFTIVANNGLKVSCCIGKTSIVHKGNG